MRKIKKLTKDSLKEIKNTYKRFLSLLFMALLGVGFFCGIRCSSLLMKETLHEYSVDKNLYDLEVISTLGLVDDDIKVLENIDGVEKVVKSYSKDILVEYNQMQYVIKSLAITNDDEMNELILKQGRMPEKNSECVVETNFVKATGKSIGDKIVVHEDTRENLKETELDIVGVVESPLYLSVTLGYSDLGAGKINAIIYMNKDNYDFEDIYTELYIRADIEDTVKSFSDEYKNEIVKIKSNIEKIQEDREKARYDSLINEATEELNKAQKELDEEKAKAEKEIADAEKKLRDAENELINGEKELNKNENNLKKTKQNTYVQFADAQIEIDKNEAELSKAEKDFEIQKNNIEFQISELKNKKVECEKGISTIKENVSYLQLMLQQATSEEEIAGITNQITALKEQQKMLEQNLVQINSGITQAEQGLKAGETTLKNARTELEKGKAELASQRTKADNEFSKTEKQIKSAKNKILSGKVEVFDGKAKLEESKREFEEKIKDAEGKLADAREEINKIENPEWYILTRDENIGYAGFSGDADNIGNISKVFPVVFFLIAILISLNSMTRMVEEQRVFIGTLKALGYSNFKIASKYILYAALATIVGGIIGVFIGVNLLPRIIFILYGSAYDLENIVIRIDLYNALLGIICISVCILGATIYASYKALKEQPASLMRPKAPALGKRVLLEKIKFIWNRLSFIEKVTLRNMFRYKKRFLMTIIGISGCTALLVVGFGLKDEVSRLIPDQYEVLMPYDISMGLKSEITEEEKEDLKQDLLQYNHVQGSIDVIMKTMESKNSKTNEIFEYQLVVADSKEELDGFINLLDEKTHKSLQLNNAIVSDKLAELLEVKVGDKITIIDNNKNKAEVEVGGIAENYLMHYVYLSTEKYEELFNDSNKNTILINIEDISEEEKDNLTKELLKDYRISSAAAVTTVIGTATATMENLNCVVLVLIVASGLLAIVVLYNLSNVNISERIRELATIKVLGFYDKEVYDYVNRETIVLTIIGILLGCVLGYVLNGYLILTCETLDLRFNRIIEPVSYIYSAVITVIFTYIINIATYFSLKKINMIEALKSIE